MPLDVKWVIRFEIGDGWVWLVVWLLWAAVRIVEFSKGVLRAGCQGA